MSAALLILLGGIVAIGFLGDLFFERTRIPDTLPLISIGILLGPVLRIVPPEAARPYMGPFGAIALTIILFEGGLDLDLRSAVRQAGRAAVLAVASFALSAFLVYYALAVGTGAGGWRTLAAAAALACTSAPIVIPVARKLLPDSPARPLLAVEAALSDALAVMTVLALLKAEGGEVAGASLIGALGASFAASVAVGLVAGILWLWLLGLLYSRRYFYVMTIGFVFLLMGGIEAFHGSGPLAVLAFGIVLANGDAILGLFGARAQDRLRKLFADGRVELRPEIGKSHAEISFLIRSFFFVYLGIIFRWPGADMSLWLAIILAVLAVLCGRQGAVALTSWTTRIPPAERPVLAAMLPRGLATAVLAAMLSEGAPAGSPSWETIAAFVVLASNIWMTLRLAKLRRTGGAGAA